MDMKHTRHWLTMVVWLLCSITASAETVASGTCGDNLTWTLTDEGELIIEGTGAMTNYSRNSAPWYGYKSLINDVIVKEGVISIGDYAFYACNNSTAITIPESVTSIGEYAFCQCNSLASITIPNGVTSIGERAFENCNRLTSINIPKNVTSIESWTFGNCSSLTSITLPEGVTSIGARAFINCSSLTSIIVEKGNTVYDSRNSCNAIIESETNTLIVGCSNTIIPEGVTSIGEDAFSGCSNLTTITIPDGVTSIGDYAFLHCSSLTSINLPESVTSIGYLAFGNCSSLTFITIPESVTRIGASAFSGCSSLTTITVAEGNPIYDSREGCNAIIKTSANTLIAGCSTTVIPESVTSIGSSAFKGCSNLTSINIPKGVTNIGDYAFDNCSSLNSIIIPESMTSIGYSVFYYCTNLATITIPEGVTSIGDCAFEGCGSLNSIIIPESVTSIGSRAFYSCNNLTSITCKAINPPTCESTAFNNIPQPIPVYVPESSVAAYQAADGWKELANIRSNIIVSGTCGDNLTWILTNEGELIIEGTGAMTDYENANATPWYDYNSSIKNVSIREGVTSIGRWAFFYCSSATSITIPNGVISIGNEAFSHCSNITSITIPTGITSIGNYAFTGCSSLTSINIPRSVTSIGIGVLKDCSSLTSIIVDEDNEFYNSRNGCNAVIETTSKNLISGCSSTVIPESVISIGVYAFSGCDNLTSITIPDGVTSIRDYAFDNCSSLTSINIPESVTIISGNVFRGCNSLISIIVEEGNTAYDSREDCNAIIESNTNTLITGCSATVIPESVTNIGYLAFYGCSNLTSITIPEGVTNIGNYAFDNCSSLTSITIPESVTSIGWYAFYDCSSLTSITIPENVTSIGNHAFSDCTSLTSITIPENVTSIGENAFYECNSLISITCKATVPPILGSYSMAFNNIDKSIPVYVPASSVAAYQAADGWSEFTNIRSFIASGTCGDNLTWTLTDEGELIIEGTGAMDDYDLENNTAPWYDYNSSIKNVSIREGVTSIGQWTFYECSNLTSITIPESVTSIGDYVFYGCNSLTAISIPENVASIGSCAFRDCNSLTAITLPESVMGIGGSAFDGCSSLTAISIPESVTSIGMCAFRGCSCLTAITVAERNTVYDSRGGCNAIIEIASNTLITGCSTTIIPSSVTNIGHYAFDGCNSLAAIAIPEGVTSIRTAAFRDCNSLAAINIPEGMTSIENQAFEGCSSLTAINIPSSVTSIGDYVFYGCNSLTAISIPENVASIGRGAFFGCSSLTAITVAERNTVYDSRGGCNAIIETASNTLITGCTTTIIPSSVTSIGEYAFCDCNSLTAINIPSSVTSIGRGAFSGCSSLTSITIPEGVTRIEDYAFHGCSSLTAITLPEGVTSIRDYVFLGCSSLTTITIPEGMASIGECTFWDCNRLTSITIPESVTSIGYLAFGACSSLTSVTVGNTVPVELTDGWVFSNRANATLYVPIGSKEAYASAAVWSEFKEIVEVGNAFVMNDATLRAGRSAQLPVALTNENETTAFQCDVYLPEGITLLKTDKGKYDITLAEERKDDHTVTSSLQNDGAIRVVVASLTSSLFAGNSGDLFYLNLQADEDISGELPLSIKNIRISESDGTRHDLNDASCVINVPAFTPADANNDGLVAIDDVVLTINYLLGDVSDNFLFVAGDMNADNQILIDDVVQIINCLLGVSTADVQDARNRMRETGETLMAGDTQCGFDVKLSNASNYVALQCDVLLPAGVGIDDVRVTSGGDHGVVFREMGDGQVRIAVTSLTNEAFASDNLLDVAISTDRQADIHITNAYAVTRGGVMVEVAGASLTHGTTGIQPAGMEAISTEIYDLNGRVVKENATSTEGLQKGIYLMNGKKVVVK